MDEGNMAYCSRDRTSRKTEVAHTITATANQKPSVLVSLNQMTIFDTTTNNILE
jgi:hypothetical protein